MLRHYLSKKIVTAFGPWRTKVNFGGVEWSGLEVRSQDVKSWCVIQEAYLFGTLLIHSDNNSDLILLFFPKVSNENK